MCETADAVLIGTHIYSSTHNMQRESKLICLGSFRRKRSPFQQWRCQYYSLSFSCFSFFFLKRKDIFSYRDSGYWRCYSSFYTHPPNIAKYFQKCTKQGTQDKRDDKAMRQFRNTGTNGCSDGFLVAFWMNWEKKKTWAGLPKAGLVHKHAMARFFLFRSSS